jgi:hypothetical protein
MKENETIKAAIAVCVLIVILCPAGIARIIYVANDGPADFNTIQAAIDDANDGDTVIIRPGTYTGPGNRDITIKGRSITVESVDPNDPAIVAVTVIDCQGTESDYHLGFHFISSNKPDTVLAGLTITNGYAINGGGIYCYDYASPTICNCRLINNHAMRGAGLYIGHGAPIVRNCMILGNSVSSPTYRGEGGGVYCGGWAAVTISGCTIARNSAFGSGANRGEGGGIYLSNNYASVRHCTVVKNVAETAGGISCNEYAPITIVDSIIRSNTASQDSQISGPPSVSYCNVQGGWQGPGNIDVDPLFVDPDSDDYHLSAGSPCIDAGDPQYVPYPDQKDSDNEPRVMGLRVDMGADEYTSSPTAVLNVYPKQLAFYADVAGPNPESQVLHIENAGYAPLLWDIAEDCPWLAISESPDGTAAVCFDVNIIGMDPGRHDCEVVVTADHVPNSPQLVDVSLYIRAARLLYVPWPYDTIQAAIEAAQDGDTVIIQPGTYTGPGNRDIDFLGKAITVRSTDPNDPAVVAATIIHCGGTKTEPHRGFMLHSGEDANSILAGLTITGGLIDKGAAIYIDGSSPTILHCNITGNTGTPSGNGGAIYVGRGRPYISQCLVSDNRCDDSLARGGGIYSLGNPVIANCSVRSNWARSDGGGIFSESGSPILSGCIIVDNEVRFGGGGGIGFLNGKGVLDHCLIAGNRSGDVGGGIYPSGGDLTIRNCTVAGNTAKNQGGGLRFSLGKMSLINTIFWGNTAPQGREIAIYTWSGVYDTRGDFYRLSGIVDILACDIGGGRSEVYIYGDPRCLQLDWRESNTDVDPLFANPLCSEPGETPSHPPRSLDEPPGVAACDYHLKSQAGRWEGGSGTWVMDDVTSPCIDAGDPNSPVGEEPEPNGGRINMGVYGGTAEASKSYPGG